MKYSCVYTIVIGISYLSLSFDALLVHFVSAPATATAMARSNHFPDHLVLIYAGGPVGRGGRVLGVRSSILLSFLALATRRWR